MKIEVDVSQLRSNGPAREFLAYCEIEVERQLNSGKDFDETAFSKAVNLAVHHLKMMEEDN